MEKTEENKMFLLAGEEYEYKPGYVIKCVKDENLGANNCKLCHFRYKREKLRCNELACLTQERSTNDSVHFELIRTPYKSHKWLKWIWKILGYMYYPVYLMFVLILQPISKLLSALVHVGMLEFSTACVIIKYMFRGYGRLSK